MHSRLLGNVHKAWREGIRATRSLARSGIETSAKQLKDEALARSSRSWAISESGGYTRFDAVALSGTEGAIPSIADITGKWTQDQARITRDTHFPRNLLAPEDLFAHPEFLRLTLHDDVIAGAAEYLGQVPRLYNLYMWWSPPNQTLKGSQRYHYDHRDSRQAKFFFNVWDVTEETGPLHFLSAQDSLSVDKKVGYSQSLYTDEQVYSACPPSSEIKAVGPAGSVYAIDTARCLHFGSRGNTKPRLVLMASFARANSVEPGSGCRVLDTIREEIVERLYKGDPVRTFALTTGI